MTLSWRRTWPDNPGPDFTLERTRDGDAPETIGRIIEAMRSAAADIPRGWSWSLTSVARPAGVSRPTFATNGFVETRQEAVDALGAAWALEAAWRTDLVAAGLADGMAPEMRAFLTRGQPTPPTRRSIPN